jgi:hypothetical protein
MNKNHEETLHATSLHGMQRLFMVCIQTDLMSEAKFMYKPHNANALN